MNEQLALLPSLLTAHIELALVAILLGTLVSVPVGIVATRKRWLESASLGTASVIQTIPSLALLAVMVPWLAALSSVTSRSVGLEIQSIGYLPAIIGLTLYSILPILRNTVTGINGVDPALREAAQGVGMTPRQQLFKVELPLALPVIVAGLRTSTVWVVGMATLSTPVGAPSLGNYIFSGLQTRNFTAVIVGCIAAAVLALVLDSLVRILETGIRERRRALVVIGISAFAVLYAYTAFALARDWAGGGGASGDRVRIGSKPFTEQYILSEIIAQHVRARTGVETEALQSLGSTVAFDALVAGDIDVYVDYTGTLWTTVLRRRGTPPDRGRVLSEVERELARRHHVEVLGTLGFENAYALAMTRAKARSLGVTRLSELAPHAPSLAFGGDYEFFGRPEWHALERTYGLEPREKRAMDPSLMYQAISSGQVDVISAYSTDGRIAALDLVVLEDDRGAIPPYDAIVLASARLARERPEVVHALRELVGAIDADAMRRLNMVVDRDRKTPAEAARAFLRTRR